MFEMSWKLFIECLNIDVLPNYLWLFTEKMYHNKILYFTYFFIFVDFKFLRWELSLVICNFPNDFPGEWETFFVRNLNPLQTE